MTYLYFRLYKLDDGIHEIRPFERPVIVLVVVCQLRPIMPNIEFIFYRQIYFAEFALRAKRKWVVYLET